MDSTMLDYAHSVQQWAGVMFWDKPAFELPSSVLGNSFTLQA